LKFKGEKSIGQLGTDNLDKYWKISRCEEEASMNQRRRNHDMKAEIGDFFLSNPYKIEKC
jgi:hypothetical protein